MMKVMLEVMSLAPQGSTTNYNCLKGAIMPYKIWLQIEEVDESNEHYENVTEPIEVSSYDELEDAKAAMDAIVDAA